MSSGSSTTSPDRSESREPLDLLAPGTVVGRYVILHVVAKGGAGIVYAAYDAELDRKLAVKFLRFSGDAETVAVAARRLRREAQVMARLSHPNVVSIHDVGRSSGHTFLAMDFVAGGTLKDWLTTPRTWHERLDLVCRAGDGLAAAHSAGIVHRDVKPSNVLVDGDQPRVTDFGIAAAEQPLPSQPPPPEGTPVPSTTAAPDETHLTEGILGTVGYLSPEQAYSQEVDARSDQFSFCVMLYEALYGGMPFANDDLVTYVNAIGLEPRRPPNGTDVPKAVHAAILRGLSERPDARFPSMTELLGELRRAMTPDRTRWWAAAGVLAVALVAATFALSTLAQHRAPICATPDATLGGAWTPEIRQRVGDAFAHASRFGAQAFVPVGEALDRYATDVAAMREAACLASRVHGTESETVTTLRLECLDDRARELATFVQVLGTADDAMVSKAAESVSKLTSVSACADVAALTAPVPPPTPDVAAAVAAARTDLAGALALRAVGRYDESVQRTSEIVERARAVGYAPLLAEAQLALGQAQYEQGHDDLAQKTVHEAIDTADEGKHDQLRGEAYVFLSSVTGRRLGHYEAAIADDTSALHVAKRLGSDRLRAEALDQLGFNHGQTGSLEQGLAETREALAIRERLDGPDAFDNARTHVGISVALSELGRFEESLQEDRRALAIVERRYGPTHPHAGIYHANLAVDLVWAGHAEEAIPEADAAIRVLGATIGTEHPDYAMALNEKSYALTKLGRYAEARPLNEEAAGIAERNSGPDSANVVYPLVGLGEDWLGLGDPTKALPILERATRIAEADDLDPETMGECHFHLARAVWLVRRDASRAAALAKKAAADYGRSPRLAPRKEVAEALVREIERSRS